MVFQKCPKCGQIKEKHAKGLCVTCYKKEYWKPKEGTCKRCKREMPIHSKGLCPGCYNFTFHLDKTKEYNYRKSHNIGLETYKRVTLKCLICGFDKIVDLHHLDGDHENNSEANMVGLCPNHHKMLHDYRYKQEIQDLINKITSF